MDAQDQIKPTTPSAGHESHLCHRCGWPFPNPHPSSKHRRAHKRVCGTIEGYTKLIHPSEAVSDDEHHSDEDKEKTPSPKIEKRIVKESGSSSGGVEERSNKSEDDLFSDAVTEFSDSGISPDVRKVEEELKVLGTMDSDTKYAEKPEENDAIIITNSADPSNPKPNIYADDIVEMSKNTGQEEESVYTVSVPSDIPLVDHAETLIQDFKDHKTKHSNVPLILDPNDVENSSIVDTSEIKTVEVKVEERKTSENVGSSMESVVSEHVNTELSAFVPIKEEDKVVSEGEVDHNPRVLTEDHLKETGDYGISQRSLEKAQESQNPSRVSETLVKEADTSQDCGVDVSVGSSSRNSLEGNWGSVSVLSTASIDAEHTQSISKQGSSSDKTRIAKPDGSSLIQLKEETADQKASEIKVQTSQEPKSSEVNETEGRKRNEEAIAKVTNWSTSKPVKKLVNESKISNPSTPQKDVALEKISEPVKPKSPLESSPPKHIVERKNDRKKRKGRASWIPFVCCSSLNVS